MVRLSPSYSSAVAIWEALLVFFFLLFLLLFCSGDINIFKRQGILETFLGSEDFLWHMNPSDVASNRFLRKAWRRWCMPKHGTPPPPHLSCHICRTFLIYLLLSIVSTHAMRYWIEQPANESCIKPQIFLDLWFTLPVENLDFIRQFSYSFEGGNNTATCGKLASLGRICPARSSRLIPEECCRFCCWNPDWYFALLPYLYIMVESMPFSASGKRGRFQVYIKLNLHPHFWMQMAVVFFDVSLFYYQSELLGNLLKFWCSLCLSWHPYEFVTFVLRSALVIITSQVPAQSALSVVCD